MKIDLLNQKHPTYQPDVWERYDALYRGGEAFRAIIKKLLPKNPQEPQDVYKCRQAEAHYCGYVGPIVDFFAAKLFSSAPRIEAKKRSSAPAATASSANTTQTDPFYGAFKEDVDTIGTDLVDFARQRFVSALVKGRSWCRVAMPDPGDQAPANQAQYEERQLGRASLVALDNEDVIDWEIDEQGRLLWAITHKIEQRRDDPFAGGRAKVRETWQFFDREIVRTFIAEYLPTERRNTVEALELPRRAHGFKQVPLIPCGFVGVGGLDVTIEGQQQRLSSSALEGFWLLARVADTQIEHFRLLSALSWNLKRTCYAMPVFQVEDKNSPPTMGAGYYIMIGMEEKFSWAGPPTEHLAALQADVAAKKDEIYRVANQMAQGVDNNAAAVGRSGQSKSVDDRAAETCLRVYGAVAKAWMERVYDLVSEARGEDLVWSVSGLDVFNIADATTVVANATQIKMLAIPSKTAKKENYARVIEAAFPNLPQEKKDAMLDEIDKGVDAEPDEADIVTTVARALGSDPNQPPQRDPKAPPQKNAKPAAGDPAAA